MRVEFELAFVEGEILKERVELLSQLRKLVASGGQDITISLLGLVQDQHHILSLHPPTREEQTKLPQGSVRTTSAIDLEEFCEKHYEKLLPIMADKYEYEKRKKEKLEEVKARLDFAMPWKKEH
ncbi:hypothetical protein Tco_1429544 [Tanacetum coccineum]